MLSSITPREEIPSGLGSALVTGSILPEGRFTIFPDMDYLKSRL
jgi:hypothetical protein